MIHVGEFNKLKISSVSENGLYLKDDEDNKVLLPNKYCPEDFEIDQDLEVFILRDSEDRLLATNLTPKIKLHEFALLQVSSVTKVGAFLDWGMEKELMVPFSEQKVRLEEGRWYVVCLLLDPQTDRLYASNRVERYLQNIQLNVSLGDKVEALVYQRSDLGYSLIVNNEHKGLIYHNEVFRELNVGEKLEAYVKNIREDNKLDISAYPLGYEHAKEKNTALLLQYMEDNDGVIYLSDKSSPGEIYDTFAISKKAFKKALGDLYRQHLIRIEEHRIVRL